MADMTQATSGKVEVDLSFSIRTHLREWKMETRERSWKTGKDRSVATGAEIRI